MTQPIVSVVTTCYNYARYIGDLAKSVASQGIPLEWIVVDDASEDKPLEILEPFRNQTNLRYVRQSENQGYSVGKNLGIRMARARYICMIDADDVLLPDSLSSRYEALSQSDRLWVHAEAWNLLSNGAITKPYPKNNRQRFRELRAEGRDLTKWYTHRLIHAQTVMLKREFHEKLGLYDESLRFSSDNEMWRRAIRFGVIPIYLQRAVALYRIHGKRMSRSAYKQQWVDRVKKYINDVIEWRFQEGINAETTSLLGTEPVEVPEQ